MAELLVNFGITTTTEALDASETDVSVFDADSAGMPATGDFRIKVDAELMLVTARSGDVLTVTRGIEGTTAALHALGAQVRPVLTAEGLEEYIDGAIAAIGGTAPAELGYAEITSTFSTTSTSDTDATGLSVTVTVGSRPVVIEAWSGQALRTSNTGDGRAVMSIYDVTAGATIQEGTTHSPNGSGNKIHLKARVNPSAGSRTYKIRVRTVGAGTLDLLAASTHPAALHVYEV